MRDVSSIITFWVAIAVLVTFLVLISGQPPFLLLVLPFALLFAWALWIALLRPKVRYNSARAQVTNILRVHEIPWARVRAVRQRLYIVFDLDDGSSLNASGVSAPRGHGVVVGSVTGKLADPTPHFGQNASALDALRASAAPVDEPVVTRWQTVPLVIGAVLVVAAVIDVIIAIASA